MKTGIRDAAILLLLGVLPLLLAACREHRPPDTMLDSLAELSIEALRARAYGSVIRPELDLAESEAAEAYRERFSADGSAPYLSFIASYDSDGNRVFTRIDIPAAPPAEKGYPAVIFVHGWRGREAAPGYDFLYRPDSVSARLIDAWVDAGFLVLSPGLRGHGTVNGVAAEGIEFLDAWDNGSYLSPMFYAIDVLNLLQGVPGLEAVDWGAWGLGHPVRVDRERIHVSGHSQGGDAVLAALAVSGEGSGLGVTLAAGSLWSGCFGPRIEQAGVYGPMATTLEAFMSGDGLWTGTAAGRDGSVNPNFVFGFPPDWIGTIDPRSPEWTWQAETWSTPTVAESLQEKFTEMYDAVNRGVADIERAEFSIEHNGGGKAVVRHDKRIAEGMRAIGGYHYEQYLTEPLHLHHSDQDYYSIPRWNAALAARINAAGGSAVDYVYPQNNHSLLVSEHDWFSSGEVIEGFGYMIERDLALFRGGPASGDEADPTSIAALRRYAGAVRNEFKHEFERPPIDGVARAVVSFTADGLKQYALVLRPAGAPPRDGWPALLMNHGHHPNPTEYGRVTDGGTDRPGDYYRGLPLAFARAGFLVVAPDFRGHNDSESGGYEPDEYESRWYARDAVAAIRALPSLGDADQGNVFMWGHSMGGDVTLRTLLALGDEIRGASIWSSSTGFPNPGGGPDYGAIETPLNIHHSLDDPVAPANGPRSIQEMLQNSAHPSVFHAYPGDDHLFRNDALELAIDRDVAFFNSYLKQ